MIEPSNPFDDNVTNLTSIYNKNISNATGYVRRNNDYDDYDYEWANNCHMTNESGFSEDAQYALEFIALLIVGTIGIIGNTLAILMFGTLKNQLKFHRLMIMISIFDMSYILLNFIIFAFPHASEAYRYGDMYCHMFPVVYALRHVMLIGSIYSTIAISMERYLVVCHPFYALSHRWSAKMYVLPIVVFSFVYNIPKFFEYTVDVPAGADDDVFSIEVTEMRVNKYYVTVYIGWVNFFVSAIIPFAIVITLNILIVKNLRKQLKYRKKETIIGILGAPGGLLAQSSYHPDQDQMCMPVSAVPMTKYNEMVLAKVSVSIVFFFVLCHSVKWVPDIYEIVYGYYEIEEAYDPPEWIQICTNVSIFLTTLNSSVNFYIYIVTHFHFFSPSGFTEFMCCKKCSKTESSTNGVGPIDNAIPLLESNGFSHAQVTQSNKSTDDNVF